MALILPYVPALCKKIPGYTQEYKTSLNESYMGQTLWIIFPTFSDEEKRFLYNMTLGAEKRQTHS
jgi:hypothetical protein